MTLADDLVAAAAEAIRDSYDDDPIRCNKPNRQAADWEARAAVAATLRVFVDCCDYPTDRRSLRALADEVGRAGSTADLLQVARAAMHRNPTTVGVAAAVSTVVQVAGEQEEGT